MQYNLQLNYLNTKNVFFLMEHFYSNDLQFMGINTAKVGLIAAMRETSKSSIQEVQDETENKFKSPNNAFSKIYANKTLRNDREDL